MESKVIVERKRAHRAAEARTAASIARQMASHRFFGMHAKTHRSVAAVMKQLRGTPRHAV